MSKIGHIFVVLISSQNINREPHWINNVDQNLVQFRHEFWKKRIWLFIMTNAPQLYVFKYSKYCVMGIVPGPQLEVLYFLYDINCLRGVVVTFDGLMHSSSNSVQ